MKSNFYISDIIDNKLTLTSINKPSNSIIYPISRFSDLDINNIDRMQYSIEINDMVEIATSAGEFQYPINLYTNEINPFINNIRHNKLYGTSDIKIYTRERFYKYYSNDCNFSDVYSIDNDYELYECNDDINDINEFHIYYYILNNDNCIPMIRSILNNDLNIKRIILQVPNSLIINWAINTNGNYKVTNRYISKTKRYQLISLDIMNDCIGGII